MKLIDAIRLVDRPAAENVWQFSADLYAICQSLDLNHPDEHSNELNVQLKAYPIAAWLCTDTHVGLYAIYLDEEAVGMTWQQGRKCNREVRWISLDTAIKVREFIISCTSQHQLRIALVDESEDIGDDLRVQFCGQALTDHGMYEGRPVRALVWYDSLMGRTTPIEYRREGCSYHEAVDRGDHRAQCVLIQDGNDKRVIPIADFAIALAVRAP